MSKIQQNTLLGGENTGSTPILLSLKSEFFEAIMNGVKEYEYRRKFRNEPTTGFAYVSSPVKEIKGIIRFDKPIVGTPKEVARVASQDPSTDKESVYTYLKDRKKGYAIPIKNAKRCSAVSLKALRSKFPEFQPPQLYCLLNKKPRLLDFLKKRCL